MNVSHKVVFKNIRMSVKCVPVIQRSQDNFKIFKKKFYFSLNARVFSTALSFKNVLHLKQSLKLFYKMV